MTGLTCHLPLCAILVSTRILIRIDAIENERNIDDKLSKPSEKNRPDSDEYWPTPIKDTIGWFTFLTIMEHTANITETNKWIIPSLLKAFAMFEFHLIGD